jgi:uracil-DNA glycosylase
MAHARRKSWLVGSAPKFSHGVIVTLSEGRSIVASYHPSQQNTFTGKLTEPMFDSVFKSARKLLAMKK